MTTENQSKNFMSGKHWLIAILIIVMGYQFVTGIQDLKKSRSENENWSNEDYNILVNRCIEETKEQGKQYPRITKEYCECSTKLVMSKVKKKDYLSISQKSIAEQTDKLLPIFKTCLKDYRMKLSNGEDK